MSLVRLNIKGISYSQTQNGAYALILNEVDGERKLPIVIGAFEAQSIAIALEISDPMDRPQAPNALHHRWSRRRGSLQSGLCILDRGWQRG